MLRDAPLGTVDGARWRVNPYNARLPARYGATIHAVRAINDFAADHSAEELRAWQRHARHATHYQCRACGRWLRVIEAARADQTIAAHAKTNACREQHARRNLVWQGFIPAGPNPPKLDSERGLALDARREHNGIWVSLVRQLREWRLANDRAPEPGQKPSWSALEDDSDQKELEALAITWTHAICLDETHELLSRQYLREHFARAWLAYMRETRPSVHRWWFWKDFGADDARLPLVIKEVDHAKQTGVILKRERPAHPINAHLAVFGYEAVQGPYEELLYRVLERMIGACIEGDMPDTQREFVFLEVPY